MLAGRLQFYKENWGKISNDPWLLKIVSGYKTDFHSHPSQTYKAVTSCTQEDRHLMEQEITSLQSKGAIIPVTRNPREGFISTLSLVPKKDGKMQPLINLKH